MPELTDLLRDAAPAARPFDEADVVARVARRRARRRGAAAIGVLAVIAGAVAAIVPDRGGKEVLVDTPVVTGTASAFVVAGGEVWLGGDGWVAREDGGEPVAVPGHVDGMVAADGVVWARGDTWVAAVSTEGSSIGTWDGGDVADIEPSGELLAVSLPADDEVVVVRAAAEGVEELARVDVGDAPTDLVSTVDAVLWVRESGDETITAIDVGAGEATRTERWSGPLLATSLSGGIWTTDGARLVDLDPLLLDDGASVAVGRRLDVEAQLVVEDTAGVLVSAPSGVTWFGGTTSDQVPVDDASADALSTGGAYLVDGEVRRFKRPDDAFADQAIGVWPETTLAEARASIARLDRDDEEVRRDAEALAVAYATEVLQWPNVIATEIEPWNDSRVFRVSAPFAADDLAIAVGPLLDSRYWVVTSLDVIYPPDAVIADDGLGYWLGYGDGNDGVWYGWDPTMTPIRTGELTIRSGDDAFELTNDEGAWSFTLPFELDEAWLLQLLLRDADGRVVSGRARAFPPGPATAG